MLLSLELTLCNIWVTQGIYHLLQYVWLTLLHLVGPDLPSPLPLSLSLLSLSLFLPFSLSLSLSLSFSLSLPKLSVSRLPLYFCIAKRMSTRGLKATNSSKDGIKILKKIQKTTILLSSCPELQQKCCNICCTTQNSCCECCQVCKFFLIHMNM